MLSPQIHASAGGGWGEIPTLFLDILLDPQMNFFTGQLETHEEVWGGGGHEGWRMEFRSLTEVL